MEAPRVDVLLVEDDDDVRQAHAQALELSDYVVHGFADAESALSKIVPGMPVVVISDVRLPGQDGLSLMKHIHVIDPEMPVVLITGHGDSQLEGRARQAGASDYLEKPFHPSRLLAAVERALHKRRQALAWTASGTAPTSNAANGPCPPMKPAS